MRTLAVDPALQRVMGGMAASDAAGEVGYGEDIVRPILSSVHGETAVLTDCQDTSNHGRAKTATGERVTVGVKDTLVNVTMARGADRAWRMATIEYEPAGSCTGPE